MLIHRHRFRGDGFQGHLSVVKQFILTCKCQLKLTRNDIIG
ncbi:Uncharacterized protein APZ42_000440 [Daphnia magna]|uniref:Uncharacterized protein n=1 Tax=Daphnia magna TaxID=35525 RepID=A0A164JN63_9CRUS|nr:Uncharacterized protein APZ42_000440 [Daphnia magna]